MKWHGSAKVGAPGLANFITAVPHFCPSLPAAFTQPGAETTAYLCKLVQELPFVTSTLKGGCMNLQI